jgi:HemY protein
MKKLLYFLGSLVVTIATVIFVNAWLQGFDSPGYVLIGIGTWSLETTLAVFAISLIVGFFVFYHFFRTLGWLIELPGYLKRRGTSIKFNRSQEALIAGLVDSAEGNWEKAESVLIKHASHSGAPLLHYLTAAKAAQSRGAFDKRDEYLRKASAHSPDANVAIGLTQAELHLSGNQFEEALQTLTKLHSIEPTHASVLKLLHQTYQHIGDWEGLRKLLPSLHTNKILMEAEIKLLETEAFSKLLKQAAESEQPETIQKLWLEIPNYIRKMPGISAIYFASMINAGAGADIEDELTMVLSASWDVTLLALFGDVQSNNPLKQIEMAEGWLSVHSDDAILLSVLGQLNVKFGDAEKAEAYFVQSLKVEPTVQAYQALGDLLFSQGSKDRASECYKNGLELASSEIVRRIDTVVE